MKDVSFRDAVKQVLVRAFIIASIVMTVRLGIMSYLTFYSTEYNTGANQYLYLLLEKGGVVDITSIDYMKKTNLTFINVKGVLNIDLIYQLLEQEKFKYNENRNVWEKKYDKYIVEFSLKNNRIYISVE